LARGAARDGCARAIRGDVARLPRAHRGRGPRRRARPRGPESASQRTARAGGGPSPGARGDRRRPHRGHGVRVEPAVRNGKRPACGGLRAGFTVTVLIYTWLASLAGAALFFTAGALWARRRVAPGERTARFAEAERDRLAQSLHEAHAELERATAQAPAGAERAAGQARFDADRAAAQARADAERTVAHARAENERLGAQLRSATAQMERTAAELRSALGDKDRLAGELRHANATLEPLARKARMEEDRAAVREPALAAVQAERPKLAPPIP